jgi:ankyrin repeat protein
MKKLLLLLTLLVNLNAGLMEDIEKFNVYLNKAKNGNAHAEYLTAIAYFKGIGTQKDIPRGLYWLKHGIKDGGLAAIWFTIKIESGTQRSWKLLELLNNYEKHFPKQYKNNPSQVKKFQALAYMLEGNIYQHGNRVIEKNETKAIHSYLKAFELKEVSVVDRDEQKKAIDYLDDHIGKSKVLFDYAIERENFTFLKESLNSFKGINSFYVINKYLPKKARYRVDMTPLLIAIQNGDTAFAKELVKHGADINLANSRGETPLLCAMRNKNIKFAEYLMQNGADNSVLDSAKNSVFSYALALRREDIALQVLENKKFNIYEWVDGSLFNGAFDIYPEYIYGNKDDQWSFCYLHLSAKYGAKEVMKKLIKMGMNLNTKMRSESLSLDALAIAVRYADLKSVKLLLNAGANPYVFYINAHPEGNYGLAYWGGLSREYTLLSMAVCREKSDQKIVDYLLSLENSSWYAKNETDFFYFYLNQMRSKSSENIYQKVLKFLILNGFEKGKNL